MFSEILQREAMTSHARNRTRRGRCKHCGRLVSIGESMEPGEIDGVEHLIGRPMIICCKEVQYIDADDNL